MTTLSPDTHPEIERMQIERLRQMPSWRKIELVGDMNETVRALALAGLRQRHPDDTPAQRRRRLADLTLGPELAKRVYGPLQEDSQDNGNARQPTQRREPFATDVSEGKSDSIYSSQAYHRREICRWRKSANGGQCRGRFGQQRLAWCRGPFQ